MSDLNDKAVNDILMCVIGEALMKADASFMFGLDFSDIINKYAPILQHKPPETEIIRTDIHRIKSMIVALNDSTPIAFLGNSYKSILKELDDLEYDICDDPENILS